MAEAKKKAAPKAEKTAKAETKAKAPKAAAAAAAAPAGPRCTIEKCKQPQRAKGYCRKHYIGWRRGSVGKHHRYKVCAKEGCRKPREYGGFCAEHAGKAAPAAEAAPATT